MYNELDKVIITINEYNVQRIIIIDNNTKDISLNGKSSNLTNDEYENFLNTFFRIIRSWDTKSNMEAENLFVGINIIEKNKKYDMFIDKYIPNNYDSFIDLINTLK